MSTSTESIPSANHTILVLPFNPSTYLEPAPLVPFLAQGVKASSSACTIIMTTPPSLDRRRSSALSYDPPTIDPTKQLYTKLLRNPRANWVGFQNFLGKMYAELIRCAWAEDKLLLRTEVLFEDEDGSVLQTLVRKSKEIQVVQLKGFEIPLFSSIPSTILPAPQLPHSSWTPPPPSQGIPVVALGGTFDHLHAAHRLLLQLAAFLTTRKLIVGVMTPSLLKKKAYAAHLENLDQRIWSTEEFLSRCGLVKSESPSSGEISMEVVEILDAYGPTAYDADIQGLVVSKETLSGGEAVNKLRSQNDLGELELFVIDVLAVETGMKTTHHLGDMNDEKELKEAKMGSTGIREWLAKRSDS